MTTGFRLARQNFEIVLVMCCEQYKLQIGLFLDQELSPEALADVSNHIQLCSACNDELKQLQELTSGISQTSETGTPSNLWASIDRGLDAQSGYPPRQKSVSDRLFRSRRWALAALFAVMAGLGLFGLNLMNSSAQASTINFGILLDSLSVDAPKAFGKFLSLYQARPGSPLDAKNFAPGLNFETPLTLPGGFRLDEIQLLQFGDHPGVAVSYTRGNDFLAAIFHAPVKRENFGTHKDYPCVVGKHHGHKVEVGPWKMVHLTDTTTCHCVLSQLDESVELPAIMAAVAPDSIPTIPH